MCRKRRRVAATSLGFPQSDGPAAVLSIPEIAIIRLRHVFGHANPLAFVDVIQDHHLDLESDRR
jgi:hypothetical protein